MLLKQELGDIDFIVWKMVNLLGEKGQTSNTTDAAGGPRESPHANQEFLKEFLQKF